MILILQIVKLVTSDWVSDLPRNTQLRRGTPGISTQAVRLRSRLTAGRESE